MDEIDKAFAEATKKVEKTEGWKCRECGMEFGSGRDARQHMFKEHENPKGLDRITE